MSAGGPTRSPFSNSGAWRQETGHLCQQDRNRHNWNNYEEKCYRFYVVHPPVIQTQTVSARSYTAPPSIGRSISPVPSYVPATFSVASSPISLPVILVSSISPIGEGASSPTPETPMERMVSSTKTETTLRQGVPQKPYSFLDEKARWEYKMNSYICYSFILFNNSP